MKSLAEIKAIRDKVKKQFSPADDKTFRVVVGMATCGIAAGVQPVYNELLKVVKEKGLTNVTVSKTGCIGACQYEPIVEVYSGSQRVTYVKVNTDKIDEIIYRHLIGGNPVEKYTIGAVLKNGEDNDVLSIEDTAFYKYQQRVALRNCGIIDPESIDEYIAFDGYQALIDCITKYTPEQVIEIVKESGLRGRGGGGFPIGVKWSLAAQNEADQKYVCCNADEGDPGAFMDRSVLEGDPHAVVEAMAIAGYAIGANHGYIYVRAEYPVAVKRLKIAINQAREYGLLGKNILGTDFSFDLDIRLGAGAFVCGEETALMASIEGKRGEPRPRPPYPAAKGLFGNPTILNNVETCANIPQIILKGSDWFASMGTEKSKGTKVFALGGKINNTGLVEIPMGTTLRQVVEEIGGGIPDNKPFKAAQTGGPSGGCIPSSYFDIEIDYDTLVNIGSMMGSGGLIVMDEETCMVDIAKFFLDFTVDESCGKCTPCHIGTKRLHEMLDKITSGNAEEGDLEKLEELCYYIKDNALCGLGQTAPNPVLSTLKYFYDEYKAHVEDKRCPAGVCKNLVSYFIVLDNCKMCTACKRACPVQAIEGTVKQPHVIDQSKCIKCGACFEACKFGAVVKR